ncbi:death-associated inhibitor of apoptosis 1 [Scaptodrosophila lebanonensis]|uniref:Death-associated inhibitor of apoptosis 1 n=1 Tax=Drosophila lebanonensis TaxID=7225 RepID=A0A6J2TAF8_DROLE|nr:death-associated inhibitor of apoptosis 1 [Scaptodrosophila lebanonensis]XP_030372331.1 death-associated inhibitor of apoptosis 1 [Scaptodrosophila lebanonensis]
MADVATIPLRFSALTGLVTRSTTTCDQVDNITNATSTQLFKALVNRMNDKYHREEERLRTYDAWPHDWLSKEMLAMTGMFYTNEGDKVKCYFCEVEVGRWERDDQPVPEHLRWSPNCPLLRRRTTNNVPINSEALDRVLPPISYDICGANDAIEVREHAYSEGRLPRSHIIQSTGVNTIPNGGFGGGSLQVVTTGTSMSPSQMASGGPVLMPPLPLPRGNYFPEYPEYAIEAARLRSFAEWPRNMKQKPQQLAEAGFFYTGLGDRVRCFSCGGGLKDWDDNDDPWEQHALWLSQCRFLKLMKGQLFIDTAQAQGAKPDDEQQAAQDKPTQMETSTTTTTTTTETETVSMGSQCNGEEAGGSATTATATSNEGDVVPQTAATRIFDKILASKDVLAASTSGANNTNNTSPTIPEEKLCKICYAGEYNTAFLPCGHVVACAKCASSVTKCPLCRKPFTDVMRVYFS